MYIYFENILSSPLSKPSVPLRYLRVCLKSYDYNLHIHDYNFNYTREIISWILFESLNHIHHSSIIFILTYKNQHIFVTLQIISSYFLRIFFIFTVFLILILGCQGQFSKKVIHLIFDKYFFITYMSNISVKHI